MDRGRPTLVADMGNEALQPIRCAEAEFMQLADALGESPQTVIPVGMLLSGACQAYRIGPVERPIAVAIQGDAMPEEPTLFGKSAEHVAALIPALEGWTCVNIAQRFASQLSALVEMAAEATGIRQLEDIYYVLDEVTPVPVPSTVRLLDAGDRALLEGSTLAASPVQVDAIMSTMVNGHVAGAIEDGTIVSLAHTFMQSARYSDVGVATSESSRGRGYATACAALVCQAVLDDGRQPVWSCGETNLASRAVAERVGFREISRRIYLVPQFG